MGACLPVGLVTSRQVDWMTLKKNHKYLLHTSHHHLGP